MTRLPLILRLALALAVFAAAAWAFATGWMVLAVPLVLASGWVFHRLFLSDIRPD